MKDRWQYEENIKNKSDMEYQSIVDSFISNSWNGECRCELNC